MRKPSVLVIHNRYQQPGGEDAVVFAEMEMLRRAGHRVVQFTRENAAVARYSPLRKASLLLTATWDQAAYSAIRNLIATERPDVAHCHNLLPLLSPAVYYACHAAGVPVVQTLHNYRLFCPAGSRYGRGHLCEDCTANLATGIMRGCYRNSRAQTAAVALMLGAHRVAQTWTKAVDAHVALSRFCHDYFVAAGLPAAKLRIKPNFLPHDPGRRARPGDYALFAGRLSSEKGVLEMLQAWQRLTHIPLLVAGEGPLHDAVTQMVGQSRCTHIKLLGQLTSGETIACMKGARFLVFPSRWHEPFGLALLEAAACGVPSLATRIGAVPELVTDGESGLLFDPDNFDQLADKADWAWRHPVEMEAMGSAARRLYRQNYTAEKNYELLTNIYASVLSN